MTKIAFIPIRVHSSFLTFWWIYQGRNRNSPDHMMAWPSNLPASGGFREFPSMDGALEYKRRSNRVWGWLISPIPKSEPVLRQCQYQAITTKVEVE